MSSGASRSARGRDGALHVRLLCEQLSISAPPLSPIAAGERRGQSEALAQESCVATTGPPLRPRHHATVGLRHPRAGQ